MVVAASGSECGIVVGHPEVSRDAANGSCVVQ